MVVLVVSDFSYFVHLDGTYLGVASHDNMLDIYHVKKGKKRCVCRGNSSYLTHFDWDIHGMLFVVLEDQHFLKIETFWGFFLSKCDHTFVQSQIQKRSDNLVLFVLLCFILLL